ncbi:MAG: AAA family ATPase [Alphaproteobacteria bacterium]|nr:AAA family ATPase [Alphaproteobacteria bacterium]
MAIAFARAEYKSRSKGGSATRSAAYNRCSVVKDGRTGEVFDFRNKEHPNNIHLGVMLPEGAPEEMADPEKLWNAAEQAEKRKDAQVAKELIVALPKEVGPADWEALARRSAEKNFVSKGLAVQIDIHADNDGNPHAHILVTMRKLGPEGFAARKSRDLEPEVTTVKGPKGAYKRVDGEHWGKTWAAEQEEYFREQGLDLKVDPTQAVAEEHLGERGKRGQETPKKARAAETEAENERAWRNPERVLGMMTKTSPTFRTADLDRQLRKRIQDPIERAKVRAAVLSHPMTVQCYDQKTGAKLKRFTTLTVIAEERACRDSAATLASDKSHGVSPASVGAELGARPMRDDQRAAFLHACGPDGVVLIQGRAGTGKTYTARGIMRAHRRDGCTVIALGPTNVVGRELADDPSVTRGGTLHAELYAVEKGKATWTRKTVVVVDEAGMVDTKVMARLLGAAAAAGAKVILIGDDRQLQSVSRGGMFRELSKAHGAAEISTVVRQKEEWQRQAAEDLSGGKVREALTAFHEHGAITWGETKVGATEALIREYAADSAARPDVTRFVLAYTNDDVHELNTAIRAIKARRGEIGQDQPLYSEGAKKNFAVGDRVQIVTTDKQQSLFNGETGAITRIVGSHVTMKFDNGRTSCFDSRQFDGFRHGYAGTIYKSQGKTIGETYVLHSTHWRAESFYVALTRQEYEAKVFVGRDVAADLEELVRQASREDDRKAATSYCSAAEADLVRQAREAVEAKIEDARTFAEASTSRTIDAAERVRRSRPPSDKLGAYLSARYQAGELWDEIRNAGGRAKDHPAYAVFEAAQAERNRACFNVTQDGVAMAALRDGKPVSAEEFAADYLMATGTKTRAEAAERAYDQAIELGLVERPEPVYPDQVRPSQEIAQPQPCRSRGYEMER